MERRRESGRWLALREREELTFRALAERSGIPVGTLAWWAWRARKEQSSGRGSQRFVEVGVVDESRSGAIAACVDDESELAIDTGFLAHVLVERFGHHRPYNRLESKCASEGFDLSRSVLCESANTCGELLEPIAEQVRKDALSTGILQTDDTPVTIQEDSHQHSRQGRVWV